MCNYSDGSLCFPFATLEEAEAHSSPGDILYVFPGSYLGISLQDNQQLLGSGTAQWVCVGGCWICLPKWQSPIITNPSVSSTILTLANGNRISGFQLEANLTCDIGILGMDVDNLTVTENLIRCPSVDAQGARTQGGILIHQSSGHFDFDCNEVIGAHQPISINRDIMPPGFPYGNRNNEMLTHTDIKSLPPYVFPPDAGILIKNFGQQTSITFRENRVSLYTVGLASYAFLNGGISKTTATCNEIQKTSFAGLDVDCFDSAQQKASLSHNTGRDNVGNSIVVFSGQPYLPPNPRAFMKAKVFRNQAYQNPSLFEAIAVATGNGGILEARVQKNKTYSNKTFGIIVQTSLSVPTGDQLCLSFLDNTSDTGFEFINNNSSGTTFNVEPVSGNTGGIIIIGTVNSVPEGVCANLRI